VSGAGSRKALQTKFRKLEAQHPGVTFPRTETGEYATAADALCELVGTVPFVDDLLAHRSVDKLLSSFTAKLDRAAVHLLPDPHADGPHELVRRTQRSELASR
jgi:DNA polymerase I-like protein with 3'-5' exonuclease and polymerase domains